MKSSALALLVESINKHRRSDIRPVWRWDLILVGSGALLNWLLTTPSSAYFLQIDTANQNFVALAWSKGCWEALTEKMVAVILLTPLFRSFGPMPYWETILLTLASISTVLIVYELTYLFTSSRVAGFLAALCLAALPAFAFFSHTYIGYIFPFLMGGWLAAHHKRWGWAGLCFGLAILAHFNSLVPVGLSGLALFAIYWRTVRWKQWVWFGLATVLPLVATEALFYFYLGGTPTYWLRSVLHFTLGYANASADSPHPEWAWVLETIRDSNGGLLTGLLSLALAAPVILWRHQVGRVFAIAFLSLALIYTVQAGLGHSWLIPRLLASAYPAWTVLVASVLTWLINRLSPSIKTVAVVAIIGVLFGLTIQTSVFIRDFSQTLYPEVGNWIQQAAYGKRPVRYEGNAFIALFYAQAYGVELLTNDDRWVKANQPGQAVLIFANQAPDNLDRRGYTISEITLPTVSDSYYPALTYEAARPKRFELWWPSKLSRPVKPDTPPDASMTALYYAGSGCLTPPPYLNGEMYFYQLVFHKLLQRLGFR